MNEPVTNDVYQQLDQRHEQVLAELDSLNERLEQALGGVRNAEFGMQNK
ncbi:MAG: hypothetical protein IH898_02530 [Planctomycetes bacterium]|nr:hypothetical protein [Planctomycetota bacterium]